MDIYELIKKRRTIRKFKQTPLKLEELKKVVDSARLAPSAANKQPLEYILVVEKGILGKIFATLKWAAYIAPAGDPAEEERPTAYIIVLINKNISPEMGKVDAGAAIENMILTALADGIGSCWLASVNRPEVRRILNVPENYHIDSVLALGYPDEQPVEVEAHDSIKYWKDETGKLHVPKRIFDKIFHFNKF